LRTARAVRGLTTLGAGTVGPTQQFALAGGVTVHGDVHVHGIQDVKAFEEALMKRSKQRAHPRRSTR
jgi:hypothetical protein